MARSDRGERRARELQRRNSNAVGLLVEYPDFRARHGARNGVTPVWLAATRPQVVVISVGRNSYGHPSPWALRYYDTVAPEANRTDIHGDVMIVARTDGSSEVLASQGGNRD